MRLVMDRCLTANTNSPYERIGQRLAQLGLPSLGPSSTAKEVNDALFDLMLHGPLPVEYRLAWDELRLAERRLLTDFFMYVSPAEAPLPRWHLPMPVQLPDFLRLTDAPPNFAQAITVPVVIDQGTIAAPHVADWLKKDEISIGPLPCSELSLLGDHNGGQ